MFMIIVWLKVYSFDVLFYVLVLDLPCVCLLSRTVLYECKVFVFVLLRCWGV